MFASRVNMPLVLPKPDNFRTIPIYTHPQQKQSEQVGLKREPLSEDKIREICSKVSKESGFDLSPATFVLAFRAAEKEYGIGETKCI
jgi:hypothetical protein